MKLAKFLKEPGLAGIVIVAAACSSQVSDIVPVERREQPISIVAPACRTPDPERRPSASLDPALAASKPSTLATKKKSLSKSEASRAGAAPPPNRMTEGERLRRTTYLAELAKLRASASSSSDPAKLVEAAAILKAKIVGE